MCSLIKAPRAWTDQEKREKMHLMDPMPMYGLFTYTDLAWSVDMEHVSICFLQI